MRTVAVKKSNTPRRKNYSKKPKVSFTKKVNAIIARNTENKITQSLSYTAPVNQIVSTYNISGNILTYNAFVWNPGDTIFTINQGTNLQQRIGNKIKVKRWIIKGFVEPNPLFSQAPPSYTSILNPNPPPPYQTTYNLTGICPNSQLGYVDIYFGKYMANIDPIDTQLLDFYQSGATSISPTYVSAEKLYRVNNDVYKIYYHKRLRLGSTTVVASNATPKTDPTFSQANGFSTTRSFGFDVTKYICKNKVLTYDENAGIPQNADIQNLTLFAVFHPASGDMSPVQAAVVGGSGETIAFSPVTNNCYYNMNCLSYAEYEDA